MKIAILSNSYPLSAHGSSVAAFGVREMALALRRAGAEVSVFAPERVGQKDPDFGIDVDWFPWSGRNEGALIQLKINRPVGFYHASSLFWGGRHAIIEACRRRTPDICLAAWALPSGYFAAFARRRLGIPYAVWCLGSDIHTFAKKPFFRGLTRRVLRGADLLYADGFELSREVTALCGHACEYLPTSRRFSATAADVPPLDVGKKHFLFAGRWEWVKGIDVLIAAWRLLSERGMTKNAVLHITGQGDGLADALRRFDPESSLRDSLDIVGWCSDQRLGGFYQAVDCVVIPSRKESIPVVFSEAIDSGTPVVVTNVGDMGELVHRYELGRVIPTESPEALANALAACIQKPFSIDENKIQDVRKLFDVDTAARKFLADVTRKEPQ